MKVTRFKFKDSFYYYNKELSARILNYADFIGIKSKEAHKNDHTYYFR